MLGELDLKNPASWVPTKFVIRGGKLRASRNPEAIAVASRLIADRVAARYDQYLKQYARGSLVDLGCGRVPLYQAYRPHVTDITCVDWAESGCPSEHLDVTCDLTQTLPFDAEQFDTVLLSDVLEHIPNPAHLWREMSRILVPGGRILLNTPFFYWLHDEPHDFYRFTKHALRRFAEGQGLTVVVLESIGGLPEILADLLAKATSDFPVVGSLVSRSILGAAALSLKAPPVRRLSEKSAEIFPLGYFLVAERAQ